MPAKKKPENSEIEPLMAGMEETLAYSKAAKTTRTRRNASSYLERTSRFKNIEDGLLPFNYTLAGYYKGTNQNFDVRDAVILCQKAYYNFAIFRNVIDLMTEFSIADIFLTGGTKKSRDFFMALFKKFDIWSLQEKFFREYYRSGNVFIHRFDNKIRKADVVKIARSFGLGKKISDSLSAGEDVTLPSRYIILNPADIQAGGNISFVRNKFYKILSDYELMRLRSPKTTEDFEILSTLSPEVRKQIKDKNVHSIRIELNPEKTLSVFYKKQDYEPLAVPMGWPVLESINAKAEMRKMDMAITRTTHQAILLVTMGTEPEKGGINQKNLEAMQKLFENESVGRVLISDYTTDAKFVIPDIADLLDPKKYEVIDRDINEGLNNVLVGGEKFANQQTKVEVFMARLKQGREAFLHSFLNIEIKRIAKSLGFKSYPTPVFEDIPLKNNYNTQRIYGRMMELGLLTPEEGFDAIQNNKLPDYDASVESQRKFKTLKDEGLYEPLIGGSKDVGDSNDKGKDKDGRPPQVTGVPQPNREPGKIGEKQSRAKSTLLFAFKAVKENLALASKLQDKVEAELKKIHKLKELDGKQKEVVNKLCEIIVANEIPSNWNKVRTIRKYIKSPADTNSEAIKRIHSIAYDYQVDSYLASILYASEVKKDA
jgi:hypothetical protein